MEGIVLKRIFHPYEKWEDAAAGMWRIVTGEHREGIITLTPYHNPLSENALQAQSGRLLWI